MSSSSPSPFSPVPSPSLASNALLMAIAMATATGSWGDVRFVVKRPLPGQGTTTLYGDLSVLRAGGADYLIEQIVSSNFRSEEEAIHASSSPVASQHAASLSRPAPMDVDPNSNVLYYPVTGIGYVTMRAILVFLQTGHISFAPLRSTISDNEAGDNMDDTSDISFVPASQQTVGYEVQPGASKMDLASSPKSVFRAARKFRLQTLRDLAMRAIDEQITPDNCLAELFGLFTLRYQEVFEKRLDYVLAHWNQIDAGERGNISQLLTTSRNRAKAQEAFNMIMARTFIG